MRNCHPRALSPILPLLPDVQAVNSSFARKIWIWWVPFSTITIVGPRTLILYLYSLFFKYCGTTVQYTVSKHAKLLQSQQENQHLKGWSHWPSLTATPSTAGGSSETISKHLPKLCMDDNDDPIQWQTPFPSAQIVVLISRKKWSMKYSPQVFPNKAFLLNQPFWAS